MNTTERKIGLPYAALAVGLSCVLGIVAGIEVQKECERRELSPIMSEVFRDLRQKEPPPSECATMADRLMMAEIAAKVAQKVANEVIDDCGRFKTVNW